MREPGPTFRTPLCALCAAWEGGTLPSQGPQAVSRLVPGPRLLYTDASQPPGASAELLRAPRKCSAQMFNHRRFHFLIFVVEPCSLLLPVVTAALELGAGHLEAAAVGTPGRREGSPLIPPLPNRVLGAKSSPRWAGLVWAEPGCAEPRAVASLVPAGLLSYQDREPWACWPGVCGGTPWCPGRLRGLWGCPRAGVFFWWNSSFSALGPRPQACS